MSTHDEAAAKCKARRNVNYATTTQHICTRAGKHEVHSCTCGAMWAGPVPTSSGSAQGDTSC